MRNQILHGDCLELMGDIPDGSIDLIVNDPPYNIKKAEWDKWKKKGDYIEWMGLVFLECQRVLKDNGSFYFFHNDFLQIVELQNWLSRNTEFVFKQLIVWDKYTKFKTVQAGGGPMCGILQANGLRNYHQFTEYILFYILPSKDNSFAGIIKKSRLEQGVSTIELAEAGGFYDKINHGGAVANWEHGTSTPSRKQWGFIRKFLNINSKLRYEQLRHTFNNQKIDHSSTVWHYQYAKKQGHITPKPVELIENIIKHSSNPGDLVLDCFAGSGTTGIACLNTGRDYILMEKEEEYFKVIKDRFKKHTAQTKLSLE